MERTLIHIVKGQIFVFLIAYPIPLIKQTAKCIFRAAATL